MSSILSRFITTRVSLATHRTSRFSPSPPSPFYHHLYHVKWCHDESHYNHGIPGVPTDGKVVLLKNTTTGSQVYLIGTIHGTKASCETVKKVINAVRPDAVAVELCMKRASLLFRWEPEKLELFRIFLRCMRYPGGLNLKRKIDLFLEARRVWACLKSGMEFKVGMEECQKVKAKLFLIDEDCNVTHMRLCSVSTPRKNLYQMLRELHRIGVLKKWLMQKIFPEKTHRRDAGLILLIYPELEKALVHERNIIMCTRLRRLEEKVIVSVVGMSHMDGIEQLWKRAEDSSW